MEVLVDEVSVEAGFSPAFAVSQPPGAGLAETLPTGDSTLRAWVCTTGGSPLTSWGRTWGGEVQDVVATLRRSSDERRRLSRRGGQVSRVGILVCGIFFFKTARG